MLTPSFLLESVMDRRQTLKWLSGMPALMLPVVATGPSWASDNSGSKLQKSKAEWATLLPLPAYRVLFEEDTERAGSSPLDQEKRAGTFICAACYLPLFDSSAKYDSGTGWPSFLQPLPERLAPRIDLKAMQKARASWTGMPSRQPFAIILARRCWSYRWRQIALNVVTVNCQIRRKMWLCRTSTAWVFCSNSPSAFRHGKAMGQTVGRCAAIHPPAICTRWKPMS